MTALEVSDQSLQASGARWIPVVWSLAAAALFLGSALLQLDASLQRWVVFRGSRTESDLSVEDHLFDYTFATEPWEQIGTTAQVFGAGTLILAFGVVIMALAVLTLPQAARRGLGGMVAVVVEFVVAALVASSFGVYGAHAFLSGITGTPSPLQHLGAVGLVAPLGLVVLALCWWRKSRAAVFACVFLIGSSEVGILVSAFVIAPLFAGGVSHDTTPWTETIVAASTAAAGIAMLAVAREALTNGDGARVDRGEPGGVGA